MEVTSHQPITMKNSSYQRRWSQPEGSRVLSKGAYDNGHEEAAGKCTVFNKYMWFITEVFGKIVWVDILSILIFYKILKKYS